MLVSKDLIDKQFIKFVYNNADDNSKIRQFDAKTNVGVGNNVDDDTEYFFKVDVQIKSREDSSFVVEAIGIYHYALSFSDDNQTIPEDFYKTICTDFFASIDNVMNQMGHKGFGFTLE